ncbi:MAG TPA: amidohydrolase [Anaerolineales bacterium]|nr:amidohydrolase [Anaerolineales bacterium]
MTGPADFIITNAKVFTSDETHPHAEAVAIQGNRILSVGSNQDVLSLQSKNTRVIDGNQKTLMPGFIDSHFHLLSGCETLGDAQLQTVKNKAELRSALQSHANENKTATWISGIGTKYKIVSTRQELDEIISDRPVYIEAYDGHTGWANTKALELAGILEDGKTTGPNGVIVKDDSGVATGELREPDAINPVASLIPTPDAYRKRELLKSGIQQINAAGVTSIHNMNGNMEDLMIYAALEDAGEISLRVYVPYSVRPHTTEAMLVEAVKMSEVQGEYVRGGAVKFFMDGVWESYTALNIEPYADNPNANSPGIYSAEHFTRMGIACDKLGLQIFVHCCGDGAVRRTLDGYEAIQKINGKRDSRHRVEHIEVIQEDDLPRFKELGVIAAMQPLHAPLTMNGDVWLDRTGSSRWSRSFAWRSIKDAGAILALGSDWTVASFNPMLGVHAALNRQKWSPEDPDQRLTLEEVLIGYTRDAAFAEFQEHQKGILREGYLADLVLLSENIFEIPHAEMANVKLVLTMANGKIVYEA